MVDFGGFQVKYLGSISITRSQGVFVTALSDGDGYHRGMKRTTYGQEAPPEDGPF